MVRQAPPPRRHRMVGCPDRADRDQPQRRCELQGQLQPPGHTELRGAEPSSAGSPEGVGRPRTDCRRCRARQGDRPGCPRPGRGDAREGRDARGCRVGRIALRTDRSGADLELGRDCVRERDADQAGGQRSRPARRRNSSIPPKRARGTASRSRSKVRSRSRRPEQVSAVPVSVPLRRWSSCSWSSVRSWPQRCRC